MFRLAHISDPHLGPLPPVRPWQLMNKRFFGYLSWVRRRRALHLPAVLTALAEDLRALGADHLVVTGDLTNIALPQEFTRVAAWLATLGSPDTISVIPGNHDAYVAVPWEDSLAKWQPFMQGEDVDSPAGPDGFPYVRYRGPLAIVGLSSALATPLFQATGTLGAAQLARLGPLLKRLGAEGRFRAVLLHHPPGLEGVAWRKRLTDAAAFRRVIAEAGAELVLHGHDHTFGREAIEGPGGPVPVLGIPSASTATGGRKPLAHYQLYTIAPTGRGWAVEVMARGYDPAGGRFEKIRSYTL
jgi:3',5'-cyclic AMP phosphodiesterase CpdA